MAGNYTFLITCLCVVNEAYEWENSFSTATVKGPFIHGYQLSWFRTSMLYNSEFLNSLIGNSFLQMYWKLPFR